jgi:radical SAM protein with 4Fe4S-binding SPASM domain
MDKSNSTIDSRGMNGDKTIHLSINQLTHFIRRHYRTLIPFITFNKLVNILVALIELKLRRTNCISKPFVFRIDPSTICNLRCPNCEAHDQKTHEKRMLDFKDFKTIINKIKKHCIRVSLYDTGEPLLNKNIYRMIKYVSDINISTLISTNLTIFETHKNLQALSESRLTVLAVSIDGITQETYSKYRIRGDVSIVKQALEAIIKHKKKNGDRWPLTDAQIIRFKHLENQKDGIERYLSDIGVDQITWKEDTWGFNPIDSDINHKENKSRGCFWLYMGPMIRPDGNVYPCCGLGFGRFPYGNIFKDNLSEIWNNRYYRFSRILFQKGPNLEYDEEMKYIPCHECNLFNKRRKMLMA